MTSYEPLKGAANNQADDANNALPKIDLNLWNHKTAIAIHWTILFVSSGVLPIVLYFALRYGAHLALGTGA
jgi:hypothetical protein